MDAQNCEPWERQPNESAKAYAAFKIYRDMGPERSQVRVANELSKSTNIIARWSINHDWVERVRLYENHIDAIETAKRKRRRRDARDRQANAAAALLKKVLIGIDRIDFEKAELRNLRALVEGFKVAAEVELAALNPDAEELAIFKNELATGNIGEQDWTAAVEAAYNYDASREDIDE